MSDQTMRFEVHDALDPNGAALAVIENAVEGSKKTTHAFKARGSGEFAIHRDAPEATPAIIRRNNVVKCYYEPFSDTVPYFAFLLQSGDFTALSTKGPGGELFKFGGPGLRALLRDVRWYHENFMGQIGTRGDGKWHWVNDQYGDIFRRGLQEAHARPDGWALPHVTWDFTGSTDSAGAAWPSFNGHFTLDIGSSMEGATEHMESFGDLFVRVQPDQLVQAFTNSWGEDRSSDVFAADKVRWAKGVNIKNDVERAIFGGEKATHVLVEGKDFVYVEAVDPAWNPATMDRVERFITYTDTDDPVQLLKVGMQAIKIGKAAQEAISLEATHGDSPLNGLYLPYRDYDVGDLMTLDTGSGAHQYDNETHELRTIALHERSTGDVRVILELNGDIATGDDDANSAFSEGGCCGPQVAPPFGGGGNPTPAGSAEFSTISASAAMTLNVGDDLVSPAIVVFQRSVTDVPGAADSFAPEWRPSGGADEHTQALTKVAGLGLGGTDQVQVWILLNATPGMQATPGNGVLFINGTGYMSVGVGLVFEHVAGSGDFTFEAGVSQAATNSVDRAAGDLAAFFVSGHTGGGTLTDPTTTGSQTEAIAGWATAFGRSMNWNGGHGNVDSAAWDLGASMSWRSIGLVLTGGTAPDSTQPIGGDDEGTAGDPTDPATTTTHIHAHGAQDNKAGSTHAAAQINATDPGAHYTGTQLELIAQEIGDRLVLLETGATDPGDIADPSTATAEDVANKLNALMGELRTKGVLG